jgi:hypothetical protein
MSLETFDWVPTELLAEGWSLFSPGLVLDKVDY